VEEILKFCLNFWHECLPVRLTRSLITTNMMLFFFHSFHLDFIHLIVLAFITHTWMCTCTPNRLIMKSVWCVSFYWDYIIGWYKRACPVSDRNKLKTPLRRFKAFLVRWSIARAGHGVSKPHLRYLPSIHVSLVHSHCTPCGCSSKADCTTKFFNEVVFMY